MYYIATENVQSKLKEKTALLYSEQSFYFDKGISVPGVFETKIDFEAGARGSRGPCQNT